jgi:hypothetical protein
MALDEEYELDEPQLQRFEVPQEALFAAERPTDARVGVGMPAPRNGYQPIQSAGHLWLPGIQLPMTESKDNAVASKKRMEQPWSAEESAWLESRLLQYGDDFKLRISIDQVVEEFYRDIDTKRSRTRNSIMSRVYKNPRLRDLYFKYEPQPKAVAEQSEPGAEVDE